MEILQILIRLAAKIQSRKLKIIEEKKTLPSQKLPTPNFGETKVEDEIKSSVFKNPFIEAENEKEAILQKHVKMVDTKDNTMVINGKKICWNYRKGRCRFGHNCKFAHDSDIQKTEDQLKAEKEAAIQNSIICQRGQMGHSQFTAQPTTQDLTEINDEAMQNKKRKRPGLTQGLIPGKKVMSSYLKNRKL
ncbi:zinc finger CCCH domain-containing protein 8 isoform X3 [Anoplophora glabripennis]|uniref:zinc finger CCCH domain-containing protein 8 isoform X3 n=1 Tax=Anoplophora glabripennis TaxID=217634 RepID=UPI000874BA12|nr:zinc finger CCCH domain-containing protein 8 isoform X3 [Anoplophora glabripennis]